MKERIGEIIANLPRPIAWAMILVGGALIFIVQILVAIAGLILYPFARGTRA